MKYFSFILVIVLYSLIFSLRYQQGGYQIQVDLFPRLRQTLDRRIAGLLPSPQAELLSGILLGNKKNLPPDLMFALRDSSTLHMIVVSGQNLSFVAGFFLALSGLIKRKTALILSFAAIIFYTILTGAQVPVLRAAFMATLAFLAEAFGRPKDGVRVLIITAALLLLINPAWITDLSFQLSFLATFGVMVAGPVLVSSIKYIPPVIKHDLAISLGAQVMVMPVIIQNFHQLSIVGIFANLFVGWTIPFIMILGLLMLVFGSLFGMLVNLLLTYFIYVIKFFSGLPFAWEYVGEQLWMVWVGYYMLIAGIMLLLKNVKTGAGGES